MAVTIGIRVRCAGAFALLLGCGDDATGSEDASVFDAAFADEGVDGGGDGADGGDERDAAGLPYATGVVRFAPGPNAGFGSERFPGNVLGPPRGQGTLAGSLDVLSLGLGGEIVLDLGASAIVDGEGPDFIVFENPFWPGGDRRSVFAELGEVSVSEDSQTWATFPCDPSGTGDGRYPRCAGWTPTLAYDAFAIVPLDPMRTGGDAFDLGELSVRRARYVRIRDLATRGESDTAGFDLDAIGVVHHE